MYRLLADLSLEDRSKVQEVLATTLGTAALPSTIVTDAAGRVLRAFPGVPTASDMAKLVESRAGDR